MEISQEKAREYFEDLKTISRAFLEINSIIDLQNLFAGSNINFFIVQVPGIIRKIQAKQETLTPMVNEVLTIIKKTDYED